MVSVHERKEAAKVALRCWADSLPDGSVKIAESEAPCEYVVRVIPRNERSAEVEFRISDYGTFGLYIGSAIRMEDLPLSNDYLLEICDAVSHGKVEEETWSRSGKLLKSIGVLRLPSGDLHGTAYRGALGTLGSDEHARKSYEPYS